MTDRTSKKSELLSAEGILSLCAAAERYRIMIYPELPSTNEEVRRLAMAGEAAGTVVLAEGQTAGRGRMGRSFFSPAGSGIYMTLLLRPSFPPAEASRITTFAAVAVARAVERVTALTVSLKWVNDLWIGKKKVCGILAESALDLSGRELSYVALGIGINVKESAFPSELRSIATSLEGEWGHRVDRNALTACILEELEPLLTGELPPDYMEEYRKRNLVLGRGVTVIAGGRSFSAMVKGIEDDGNLIVVTEDGTEERIVAGEVSLKIGSEKG